MFSKIFLSEKGYNVFTSKNGGKNNLNKSSVKLYIVILKTQLCVIKKDCWRGFLSNK